MQSPKNLRVEGVERLLPEVRTSLRYGLLMLLANRCGRLTRQVSSFRLEREREREREREIESRGKRCIKVKAGGLAEMRDKLESL